MSLRTAIRAELAAHGDVAPFDVHAHTGADVDGTTRSSGEHLRDLEAVGGRSVIFPLCVTTGYEAENRRLLDECARAPERLTPFARLDPKVEGVGGAAADALAAGARGFKLHPRSEDFRLDHPGVDAIASVAAAARVPVLIHAGLGVGSFGPTVTALAERHRGCPIVLAHAAISDLSWLWEEVPAHPNLFFDTSWWNPADLITLFSLVPPGQVLYGSDAPYGRPVLSVTLCTRTALQAGLNQEQIRSVLGGQTERLLNGEPAADMGPPSGKVEITADLLLQRVTSSLAFAMAAGFMGIEERSAEAISLAQLACEVGDDAPEADVCRSVLAALEVIDELGGPAELGRGKPALGALLMALCVAWTPDVPLPAPPADADVGERQHA